MRNTPNSELLPLFVLLLLLQMATGQPYGTGPDAHYTTHPFAAQPYGPVPYYTGQQQGCPAPVYTANQPPPGYPVNSPQQQQQQQGGPGNVPVVSY
jgi:hypothetical protein